MYVLEMVYSSKKVLHKYEVAENVRKTKEIQIQIRYQNVMFNLFLICFYLGNIGPLTTTTTPILSICSF